MTLIIAEAGVNHNGSEELALKLIREAHRAGADIVKFQTFKADSLVTDNAEQAEYQVTNTGVKESQHEMLKRLELSFDAYLRLVELCNELQIEFLSTAFDKESLEFLVNELGLRRLKIPSGEITNAPFILEHARTGCELIISTGMCNLSDIEMALGVIAFGLTESVDASPSLEAFERAYASEAGQAALSEKVTVLHCTTEYPAPLDEINLRVMDTFQSAFGLPVGYSDHSEGLSIPIAAVAKGAVLIEKHFTLDRTMEGPDHKASLEPSELAEMVRGIRDVERALGSSVKRPTVSEVKNKFIARKSLVASGAIRTGEVLCDKNIACKRPGSGISPTRYWEILGRKADRDYSDGDLIVE